ncbi:asparagine synthase (glutamine-hydrolyzing) [bacterium]|nr:asparagine synthase (glutamine-hydrolyzing) [bacterium]
MCGFVGEFNSEHLAEPIFKEWLEISKHRGPDDSRLVQEGMVQFGFNRLSIQDLTDAGAQPMRSPSGRFLIMLNGELYNHLSLRKSLPEYNYKGHSDTETLCWAIDQWGITKAISSLDGMFAIAIYDLEKEELFLIRDFAGIKPLFYGTIGHKLLFSSQYDQLMAHPLLKDARINQEVLGVYLRFHYMPAPLGLYENTAQVLPGEMIRFTKTGFSKMRYWELPTQVSESISDENKALEEIDETMLEVVRDQLIADVPVGAFLSGGVDSPLICAQITKLNPNLKVFSIGSDSAKHDESALAIKYAQTLNLKQNLKKLDPKIVLEYWDEAIEALHEPLADFSIIPTYIVSKLAKQDVTVALSGDGGDELFYGYDRFWSVGKNISFQGLPHILRKGLYGIDKIWSGNRNINDVILSENQSSAHQNLHSRFKYKNVSSVFPHLDASKIPLDWTTYSYNNSSNPKELLHNMRHAEFYGMMQKTLRKVDLASMQNSLEVRVPLLQKKFIEMSLTIDHRLSYDKGNKKQILKTLLKKYIPNYEDDGVKRGFNVPLGDWIRKDLKLTFQEQILEGKLQDIGMSRDAAELMLKEHHEGKDRKWPLFTLYALSKQI